jgi:hypothetical protein
MFKNTSFLMFFTFLPVLINTNSKTTPRLINLVYGIHYGLERGVVSIVNTVMAHMPILKAVGKLGTLFYFFQGLWTPNYDPVLGLGNGAVFVNNASLAIGPWQRHHFSLMHFHYARPFCIYGVSLGHGL